MADYEMKGTVISPKEIDKMKKISDLHSEYFNMRGMSHPIVLTYEERPSHIKMMARQLIRNLYNGHMLKEPKLIDYGKHITYMSIDEFKESPIEPPDTKTIEVIMAVDTICGYPISWIDGIEETTVRKRGSR